MHFDFWLQEREILLEHSWSAGIRNIPSKLIFLEVESQYAYVEDNIFSNFLEWIVNQCMSSYVDTLLSVILWGETNIIFFHELVPHTWTCSLERLRGISPCPWPGSSRLEFQPAHEGRADSNFTMPMTRIEQTHQLRASNSEPPMFLCLLESRSSHPYHYATCCGYN